MKRAAAPIAILVLAGIVFVILSSSRNAPGSAPTKSGGAFVETQEIQPQAVQPFVRAYGTVSARRSTQLSALVSGEVVEVNDDFLPGRFFSKSEVLFKIDPRDFSALVAEREASVVAAKQELATVKANAEIAREQWESLKDLTADGDKAPSPLVLYQPQLESAKAKLKSASALLEKARNDLSRTEVRAPYDCVVRSITIGLGQYVRVGEAVAEVSGTSAFEVKVPLSAEERLAVESDGGPIEVKVSRTSDGAGDGWSASFERFLMEVDAEGHMSTAVVRIDDPIEPQGQGNLSLGSFVQVTFRSAEIPDQIVVPRFAIRPGSTVWLIDENSQLRKEVVGVKRIIGDKAVIGSGLEPGEPPNHFFTGCAD